MTKPFFSEFIHIHISQSNKKCLKEARSMYLNESNKWRGAEEVRESRITMSQGVSNCSMDRAL